MRKVVTLAGSLLLGAALIGCGPSQGGGGGKAPTPDFEQPIGGYSPEGVMVPLRHSSVGSSAEDQVYSASASGAPRTVFVNRGGGTFYGGQDDSSHNISSVVASQGLRSATIPPLSWSDGQWQQFVSCIQDEYSRFNVNVTDQRPAAGPYIEAVIGGTSSAINYGPGIGGIAPVDTYYCRPIPGAVVFIFGEYDNPQTSCEIAAQEIGHAIVPLDHEYTAADPMTYLAYNGHKTFQDVNAYCGEYQPRQCFCGRASQDSVQILASTLGLKSAGQPTQGPTGSAPPTAPPMNPGSAGPSAQVLSPATGATLQGNGLVQVQVKSSAPYVWLYWSFVNRYVPCDSSVPAFTCQHTGDTWTWTVNVGTGPRQFYATAEDAAGNQASSQAVSVNYTDAAGGMPTANPTNTAPPAIRVDSPADGTTLTPGGPLNIQATVQSANQIVEVLVNWQVESGQAYTFAMHESTPGVWTLSNTTISTTAVLGTRTFTVTATDNTGLATTSPPVTLTVSN